MGIEQLRLFLSATVPDERLNILMLAYERLLLQFGDEFDNTILTMLTQVVDQDVDVALSTINNQTILFISEALAKYGIYVNQDVIDYNSLPVLSNLFGAIMEVEDYEDAEQLYDTLVTGESSEESFFEMLAIFSNSTASDYLTIVSSVSSDVIDQTKELLKENILEQSKTDKEEAIPPISDSIKQLASVAVNIEKEITRTLVRQPKQVSLKNLLRVFGNRLAENVNNSCVWLLLVYLSKDGTVKDLVDNWSPYFLDEKTMLETYAEIDRLLERYPDD